MEAEIEASYETDIPASFADGYEHKQRVAWHAILCIQPWRVAICDRLDGVVKHASICYLHEGIWQAFRPNSSKASSTICVPVLYAIIPRNAIVQESMAAINAFPSKRTDTGRLLACF